MLGATGSIGRQTLDVADRLGAEVVGLAAGRPSVALAETAARYPGARVAVAEPGEPAGAPALAGVAVGPEAVAELAASPGAIVVNGIVGAAGLRATLSGLEVGNRVALANKESMVAGGELVRRALAEGGGELVPVDSEHSALFQCLRGEEPGDVARLILTASGGPFRRFTADGLKTVRPEDALAHPTWDMGGRITVDSATLVNKGLEVIEAHHLFGIDLDRIAVVVHPQSIVHSAVEFVDGSLKAHVGYPDMAIPIQYALTYPRRRPGPGPVFELAGMSLEFEPVNRDLFPALDLAYSAGRTGGTAPAAFNAADEVAVASFLTGDLAFVDIARVLEAVLAEVRVGVVGSLADVEAADADARDVARSMIEQLSITSPRG